MRMFQARCLSQRFYVPPYKRDSWPCAIPSSLLQAHQDRNKSPSDWMTRECLSDHRAERLEWVCCLHGVAASRGGGEQISDAHCPKSGVDLAINLADEGDRPSVRHTFALIEDDPGPVRASTGDNANTCSRAVVGNRRLLQLRVPTEPGYSGISPRRPQDPRPAPVVLAQHPRPSRLGVRRDAGNAGVGDARRAALPAHSVSLFTLSEHAWVRSLAFAPRAHEVVAETRDTCLIDTIADRTAPRWCSSQLRHVR